MQAMSSALWTTAHSPSFHRSWFIFDFRPGFVQAGTEESVRQADRGHM